MAGLPRELTVTLERAEGMKDHDFFTKQDPYAIITCGARKQRSRVHKSGGSNPVWNQKFTFTVVNEQARRADVRTLSVLPRPPAEQLLHEEWHGRGG